RGLRTDHRTGRRDRNTRHGLGATVRACAGSRIARFGRSDCQEVEWVPSHQMPSWPPSRQLLVSFFSKAPSCTTRDDRRWLARLISPEPFSPSPKRLCPPSASETTCPCPLRQASEPNRASNRARPLHILP